MSSQGWWRAAALSILLLAVCASGCINIEVVDRTPSTSGTTPSTQGQQPVDHNLAVLAVDFDPPLEYDEIMSRRERGEGITLLVAVENTGVVAEENVTVSVELAKDGAQTVFLRKQAAVGAIAPGEIKLVRFKDTEIPFSYEYQLKVHVAEVEGETNTADNTRTYDLLITQP